MCIFRSIGTVRAGQEPILLYMHRSVYTLSYTALRRGTAGFAAGSLRPPPVLHVLIATDSKHIASRLRASQARALDISFGTFVIASFRPLPSFPLSLSPVDAGPTTLAIWAYSPMARPPCFTDGVHCMNLDSVTLPALRVPKTTVLYLLIVLTLSAAPAAPVAGASSPTSTTLSVIASPTLDVITEIVTGSVDRMSPDKLLPVRFLPYYYYY